MVFVSISATKAMKSSRIWLSITALLSGAMSLWAAVSLNQVSPINFGALSPLELLACIVGYAIPPFLWAHLFFRQRGQYVVIGSRIPLSVSAFLCGAGAVMALLELGIIPLLSALHLPTLDFVLFVVGVVLPILVWLSIFLWQGLTKGALAASDCEELRRVARPP